MSIALHDCIDVGPCISCRKPPEIRRWDEAHWSRTSCSARGRLKARPSHDSPLQMQGRLYLPVRIRGRRLRSQRFRVFGRSVRSIRIRIICILEKNGWEWLSFRWSRYYYYGTYGNWALVILKHTISYRYADVGRCGERWNDGWKWWSFQRCTYQLSITNNAAITNSLNVLK